MTTRGVRAPIRVLVVDDSAVVRQALGALLARDPAIELVGTASDAFSARDKIRELRPDVLTLDVEMPRMDGLSFLEKLMRVHPMPVVMVASATGAGCAITLRALELGAVDFVTKPTAAARDGLAEVARQVIEKVKAAATARVGPRPRGACASRNDLRALVRGTVATPHVIAVGASTGGTEALREFLGALSEDAPAVVVVQHMPERFTRAFAQRLDGLCAVSVKEAVDGDTLHQGHVLIAPGNQHMHLTREGARYVVRLSAGAPVNRHRPSVDVLFHTCADQVRANAVGVIMTGMGEDGARGLLAMRRAGARTLAQDEDSCVVFGMPKVAVELGAVDEVLPLSRLAPAALAGTRTSAP
jgi:two-component system, chemotaxis family, protein-glutamate methylesterase/glutaminase